MLEQLKKFEEKRPEIVFEWKDSETDAEGWVVINSLKGGAAGGGTRMRKGLDKNEVIALAKTMEIKFSIAGPAIGGAKSGINFDPADPRKKDVLTRWYQAVLPLLKHYYGTGGDLNVDEVHEVIPITAKLGLLHPQEGVVCGHFGNDETKQLRIDNLRKGVSKVISDTYYSPDISNKYLVADMITGFGVSESVRLFYELQNHSFKNKRVIVQGWGNVASAAAYYAAQCGAGIVGIIDRAGGLINENGFTFEEIRELFISKNGNALNHSAMLPFEEVNKKIWSLNADVFLPCAASRILTMQQMQQLISNGLQVVSCGANVPFADKEIFFGPIAKYVDEHIALIPDFIANCGMARVFAYLMSKTEQQLTDKHIFNDVTNTIKEALQQILRNNNTNKNIAKTAFEISLQKITNKNS
jgi:glutamate dehydrogenase/leucine dehydrogenase